MATQDEQVQLIATSMCVLLDVLEDNRATAAASAAVAWARRRRRNNLDDIFTDPDVKYGTTLYASLLYQSRATPLGMSGFDESALYNPGAPEALHRARELVGLRPAVA